MNIRRIKSLHDISIGMDLKSLVMGWGGLSNMPYVKICPKENDLINNYVNMSNKMKEVQPIYDFQMMTKWQIWV